MAMARSVEQIEQEIADLEQAVEAIAQEFQAAYCQYLTGLGQAVRQQLILASYYLCTQGYPDQFLKLSLGQRQELQQALRSLAQEAQTELLAYLDRAPFEDAPVAEPEPPRADEDDPSTRVLELAELVSQLVADASHPQFELLEADATDEDKALEEAEPPESPEPTTRQTASLLKPHLPRPPLSKVEKLARWHEQIESGMVEVLQTLSQAANRLLHQADILPNRLPEAVIAAATKAGMASEAVAGPPNLLNLLIEGKSDAQDDVSILRIIAIRLRLGEIEFSHAELSNGRSQLRKLNARLVQLGRTYQKKTKERAIAQAEHAWRASWFDESS